MFLKNISHFSRTKRIRFYQKYSKGRIDCIFSHISTVYPYIKRSFVHTQAKAEQYHVHNGSNFRWTAQYTRSGGFLARRNLTRRDVEHATFCIMRERSDCGRGAERKYFLINFSAVWSAAGITEFQRRSRGYQRLFPVCFVTCELFFLTTFYRVSHILLCILFFYEIHTALN